MDLSRLCGGGLLLVGAGLASLESAKEEKRKLRVLASFSALVRHIGNRLECASSPLPAILQSADAGILAGCGINPGAGETRREAMRCAEECEGECGRKIREFFSSFGNCYREEQLSRCRSLEKELEDALRQEKNAYADRVKLKTTLYFCGALGLVLALW